MENNVDLFLSGWIETNLHYAILFVPLFAFAEACIGIGLSLVVVLYSTVASVIGYSYYLQMGITIGLDIVLLFLARHQISNIKSWTNRLENWQWLLLALIVLVYVGPAFVIPVPFDTDAQGFG